MTVNTTIFQKLKLNLNFNNYNYSLKENIA